MTSAGAPVGEGVDETAGRLRRLRWWDIERVGALERELFPDDPWTTEAFWAELALGAGRVYLVAEDAAGGLLGYAGLSCPAEARGGDAEIMTIAVARSAQGRGTGRALLEALAGTATVRGAGRLLLEVRADNAAARRLYAAAGFAQIGLRAGYYRAGPDDGSAAPVDAIILRRPLRQPAAPLAADSVAP